MSRILLEADRLRKSFGTRQLIDLDHLTVYDNERIGLIGENGAGKTTLLRILSGEEEADEGMIHRPGSLAFIHQQGKEDGEEDRQLQALFRTKARREGLSGGEMTRKRIAAALSARPQLLLADEPTTDLDEEGLAILRKSTMCWLARYGLRRDSPTWRTRLALTGRVPPCRLVASG